MSRTLAITATDPPLVPGEIVTLVRAGWMQTTTPFPPVGVPIPWALTPPPEFVEACAPCETCGGGALSGAMAHGTISDDGDACTDCRIELVGRLCSCGNGRCMTTIADGYAVGEPEPTDDGRWTLKVQVVA